NLVELIAAQASDPFRRNNSVSVLAEFDERNVEGAATEIVDQHRGDGLAAMREFDSGSRRLIEHSKYMETGAAEGFDRHESLVAGGVGRYAEHHFEAFLRAVAGSEVALKCADEAVKEFGQGYRDACFQTSGRA